MRLAAQMRGGFYPAHPNSVAHAATCLRPPQNSSFAVLDPCAGTGAAIKQLANVLGCPDEMTYAIELDDDRAEALRANLPEAQVLAPASFFGCRATFGSFSFIWLNSPFDHSYGGYRVEDQFLRTATQWLMPGGVMALVCPESSVDEYSDARQHFTTYYENCAVIPFPEKHRPFNEVVVLGHKRARPNINGKRDNTWETVQAPGSFVYHIPPGAGPKTFEKIEPTESELRQMLSASPLRSRLSAPPRVAAASPPLALGIGHVALLLASGQLDGVVHPEGQMPHVVRGTSRKREFVSDVTEIENPDGTTTTKTTISERIDLVVRTVDLTGELRTFMDGNAQDD